MTAKTCDIRCKCSDCEKELQEKFLPFHIQHWSSRAQMSRVCPTCRRAISPTGRKGFLLWYCWQCSMKRAVITAVINNVDSERTYGFAQRDQDKATVYFHFCRQRVILFDGSDYPMLHGMMSHLIVPDVGDRIIYHEMVGNKTLKALWWGFEEEYEEALRAIDERQIIRFVWRDGRLNLSRLQEKPKYRILWEGKNLEELRQRFNRSVHPSYEKGHVGKYFEAHNPETDAWEKIDDPR